MSGRLSATDIIERRINHKKDLVTAIDSPNNMEPINTANNNNTCVAVAKSVHKVCRVANDRYKNNVTPPKFCRGITTCYDNHSNDNLDEIYETTDLDKCRIPHMDNEYEYEKKLERRSSYKIREIKRLELHKKEDVYGTESINKKRVEADIYGGSRRVAELKFKLVRDERECTATVGRTMNVRVRVAAVVGLLLALLASSAAAPARSRPGRAAHHEINAVSPLLLTTKCTYLTNKITIYPKKEYVSEVNVRLIYLHVTESSLRLMHTK